MHERSFFDLRKGLSNLLQSFEEPPATSILKADILKNEVLWVLQRMYLMKSDRSYVLPYLMPDEVDYRIRGDKKKEIFLGATHFVLRSGFEYDISVGNGIDSMTHARSISNAGVAHINIAEACLDISPNQVGYVIVC